MASNSPYVLSASAFQEFLDDTEAWREWHEPKVADSFDPHALFVSAHTFGQARLSNASFQLSIDGDEVINDSEIALELEESKKLDSILFEMSNAGWKRRILPVNARVMNLVTEAFRTIDEYLPRAKDDENDEDAWYLSIDALIEYATAVNWDATLIYAGNLELKEEELFLKLETRIPKFRIENLVGE